MDNVAAFSKALHSFNPLLLNPPGNLSCDLALPWSSGLTLINYISSVSLQNGTTGDIKFSEGERVNIELDVLRMDLDGLLISVGSWSIENGLSINQSFSIHVSTNVTLIVTTVLVRLTLVYFFWRFFTLTLLLCIGNAVRPTTTKSNRECKI